MLRAGQASTYNVGVASSVLGPGVDVNHEQPVEVLGLGADLNYLLSEYVKSVTTVKTSSKATSPATTL